MKRKTKGTQQSVDRLLGTAQKLNSRRLVLTDQIAGIDAALADLRVEWADLQKEIADQIFEFQLDPPLRRRSRKKTTVRNKTARRKLKTKGKRGVTNVKGTREEIVKAAHTRDEAIIKLLRKNKPMTMREIQTSLNDAASTSQIQVSLKRQRKLLKKQGSGARTAYSLKRK